MSDSAALVAEQAGSKPSSCAALLDVFHRLRNPTFCSYSGYLVEAQLMELLEELGVPIVRCWEGSVADGVLIDKRTNTIPVSITSSSEKFLWAVKNIGHLCTLTFDAKYTSFRLVLAGTLPAFFVYSIPPPPKEPTVQLGIIKFQGVKNYVCIIPVHAWQTIGRSKHHYDGNGVVFITRIPPAMYIFAVHIDHISEACQLWIDSAKSGNDYKNPTTQTVFRGCRLKLSDRPPLTPKSIWQSKAYDSIEALWHQIKIDQEGHSNPIVFHVNHYAPLIADFLLEIDGDLLGCEHKTGAATFNSEAETTSLVFSNTSQAPFAPGRQWHFIIWEMDAESMFCMPKSKVPRMWKSALTTVTFHSASQFVFRGRDRIHRMLEMIRKEAKAAILEVEKTVSTLTSGNSDDWALIKSSTKLENAKTLIPTSPKTLPASFAPPGWFLRHFNQQCRQKGSLVVLPLDPGHPFGDSMVVKHSWTKAQQGDWDRYGKLPIQAYEAGHYGKRCVVLRRLSLHGSVWLTDAQLGLWLKRQDWQPLICDQPYIMLGGIFDPSVSRDGEPEPACLLLPSEFTVRPTALQTLPSSHQGQRCIRRRLVTDYTIPGFPAGHCKENQRFEANSEFVAPGIDPLRFLVQFHDGTIHETLNKLVTTRCSMRVENPRSSKSNPLFKTSPYHTTIGEVNQAAWDYGLRRSHNKGVVDVLTAMNEPEDTTGCSRQGPEAPEEDAT